MSTIVTRSGKGSPLSHVEVDANFTNLNTDKIQSGNTVAALTITSATINGGSINGTTVGDTTRSTGAFTTIASNGATTFTAGTASTSTTTGTAVITGGLGVSGRINAANFDGIVGANTAAAGTFTSLSDSGNLTFTGTGNRITGDFSNGTQLNRVAFQTSTTNAATVLTVIPNGTGTQSQLNLESDPSIATGQSAQFAMVGNNYLGITSGIRGAGSYVPIIMATGGSERLRIDTSGNVGIGTSSPAYRLDVQAAAAVAKVTSTTGTNYAIYQAANTSGVLNIGLESSTGGTILTGTSAYSGIVATSGAYPLAFGTSNTERMRIDSSGNVLVGTTSQIGTSVGNFYSSLNGFRNFTVQNGVATGDSGTYYSQLGANASSTSSYHFIGNSNAADKVYIYGNGNIVNVNNSYGTLSDVKLKENIVDASEKLDDVMKLKVRNFNLKSDPTHKQIGFVAQELEQVFPSMVDETQDRTEDGSTLETYTKSIKTSVLVPILVKAIQEQQTLIENLTTRLNALEGK